MQFLDIHTHQEGTDPEVRSILSLSLTGMQTALPEDRDISVGLHPWFATMDHLEADYIRLVEAAKKTQVKLIGECGLDRLKGESLENQLIVLKKQLTLAVDIHKPVILHCVRCFDELIALKKEIKPTVPLIIHGYNKNEQLGRQLLFNGFYLSFGKAILNAESGAAILLKEAEVFFLETDDAHCDIREIYQAAANLKKCTIEEVKALIFASWEKIKLI
ncbi:TatD family hydrolase [Pedobacter nyackensis]|uniref:TatD DNase family protein n=1 Tax=Pedobacter nyackensis TaxID=475255 RepID=A0A1W2BSZ2_9SPHI|nr:TatD family hydrolase [Pedobacter nyackensis]SMC75991.1 TatD DNase family protein [Pedobacter nyackensis]